MSDSGSTPSPDETPRRRGFSRRSILGTGAGGIATAIVWGHGLRGAEPAAAEAVRTPAVLSAKDPHFATGFVRRASLLATGIGTEITILPLDRAKFQVGGTFDLRIEATGVDPETTRIVIKVAGRKGPVPMLSPLPLRTSSAEDSVEVTYQGLAYGEAGSFTISAEVTSTRGSATKSVTHEVVLAKAKKPAKNVIFFLGDGMGQAAITGARILSKGIVEGKYKSLLEMDTLDHHGKVTTSGCDSIATDSANSMSAYMTGHKSAVNALGVYPGNSEDPTASPHVETMAEVLKRSRDMSIGIVTTAEVQDATPAAVFAHTRRRSEYVAIMDQALLPGQMPDVFMGGGRASFLPQTEKGSRRKDDRNLIEEFKDKGFAYAGTRAELNQVMASGTPDKLLGTFHNGNLNVYIDRQVTPNPEVLGDFPDQPGLVEMTGAALKVLEKNDKGFFLMVEGASIDKSEHPLDGPRALFDTIELDQAVGLAKEWAKDRDDTLIVVTADHNHAMSIAGTHTLSKEGSPARQQNGVYADAGFPTYVDSTGDGFPDDPNPDVQIFFGWSNHPDHPDDFAHNAVLAQPALLDAATDQAVPNPARDPGSVVQVGNLPLDETNCVHTVEDVSISASGPGSQLFGRVIDNTEVFHAICGALALEIPTYRVKSSADDLVAEMDVAAQQAQLVG